MLWYFLKVSILEFPHFERAFYINYYAEVQLSTEMVFNNASEYFCESIILHLEHRAAYSEIIGCKIYLKRVQTPSEKCLNI